MTRTRHTNTGTLTRQFTGPLNVPSSRLVSTVSMTVPSKSVYCGAPDTVGTAEGRATDGAGVGAGAVGAVTPPGKPGRPAASGGRVTGGGISSASAGSTVDPLAAGAASAAPVFDER